MVDRKTTYGIVGYYKTVDDLIAAARRVRDAGFTRWDSHTPFPVHGIDGAMGIQRTILPWITLSMGLLGLAVGIAGQWWVNSKGYDFQISGKPSWSLPANIPVAFEVVIAFSAFTTFLGMLALNRLPRLSHPLHRLPSFARVSQDRFAVVIEAEDPAFDAAKAERLLTPGAESIVACPADPSRAALPIWFHGAAAVATCLTLVPLAMAYRGRHATSENPRFAVWTDMSFQRKAAPQTASSFFPDGMAMRPPVAGTVAVGHLNEDDAFHLGIEPGTATPAGMQLGPNGVPLADWLAGFPSALIVDEAFLDRGQQRFDIYCSVCHGKRGDGLGSVALRARDMRAARWGWVDPKNLLASGTVARENGELFHIASHGISTMKGYAAQIRPEDRWAIVAWVRALQASQAIDARKAPPGDYRELPAAIKDAIVVAPPAK